ncbi:MAG: hypothetical protein K2P81_00845 [Bacteriovoracaceae bacterium]|nr:hypothetical protein [Bacteriovoracaceae bacterium]
MSISKLGVCMSFMKYVLLFGLVLSNAYAEVTCQSVAIASCLSPDMTCLEFFEESMGDEEMWEGVCDETEGTYSTTPCDASQSVMKCLTKINPISPVMYLLNPMTREEASTFCSSMLGQACN